ncbi:unnamed protein product [Blumeria hordei]|uniref:Uncharacterized protein n=1 Tax=Blumeria hordei TaxID=2867405 RepID=A0A383UYS5_BLUHO|nr:unnamed protein product [Blumeria hordei]
MNCILAFFLLAGDRSQEFNRLATMPLSGHQDYYRMYAPNKMQQFRGVEAGSDIILATSQIRGPGTYLAVYCSPSKSSRYIVEYITEGADHLDQLSKFASHQPNSREINCLTHIRQELKILSGTKLIPIRNFWYVRSCNKSTIYSLAFQNYFCIQDIMGNILTPCKQNQQRIGVDNQFLMSEVILGHRFFLKTESNGMHTALAWFQGYFNIFQKGKFETTWRPMRNLIQKNEDYHPITEFIAKSFAEIGSIKSALTQDENKIISTSTSTDDQRLKSSNYPKEENHIKNLLQILSQKDLRLSESPAHGLICPFTE